MFNEKTAEQWRHVVERCWADDTYKQALIDDPKKILAEAGISFPEGIDVAVVENRSNVMHLVLPAKPGQGDALPAAGADAISAYNPAIW